MVRNYNPPCAPCKADFEVLQGMVGVGLVEYGDLEPVGELIGRSACIVVFH